MMMEMTMCQNPDQTIIALAEALGRQRALTDQESVWLERSVRREDIRTGRSPLRSAWSPSDDAALISYVGKFKPDQIARTMQRSVSSVYQRIHVLKKREVPAKAARKRARKAQVEGVPA